MEAWTKSVLGAARAGALLIGAGALPAQAVEDISMSNGEIIGRGTAVTAPTLWTATLRGGESLQA